MSPGADAVRECEPGGECDRCFNLATVAEGIEVAEQEASLRALGCDVGQGYLLGRPGSEVAMEARIREELDRISAA